MYCSTARAVHDDITADRHFRDTPPHFARSPRTTGCGEVHLHGGKEGVLERIGRCVVREAVDWAGRLLLHDPAGPVNPVGLHIDVRSGMVRKEKPCWTFG